MTSDWLRPLRPNRRPILRPRTRLSFAPLERRDVPNSTPFDLSTGNLTQNWSDASLITVDDNWDTVPSIVGYRGDNGSQATGVDPQTILLDLSGMVDVNANRSDPDTFISGGVAEFDGIADPSVALNGSGTADAPNLVFFLNTTDRQDIRIQYNVRDLDASVDNSVQQVALQYRVGSTGNYINLPAGFIADATEGGTATMVTAVDVTLPADANNQPLVCFRVMTANAIGNDEWVGVDDINVGSTPRSGVGALQFSAATYQVSEDGGTATITVARTGGSTGAVSVQYATSDGTATAGSDYTATSGTLNFADNQLAATFTIPITNDSTQEPNETVNLTLSNPTGGATLGGQSTAVLTILDNDAPGTFAFSQTTFTRGENGGTATITVTRSGGTGGAVSVQFATSDGTATAGSDYTANSGTLNFGDGVSSQTFTVAITDDTILEGGETVNLTLSNPTGGATIGTVTSTLTILDNDLLLNEVDVDPPGSDDPFEYAELKGTPGASLDGYYFVSVEGDQGAGTGVFTQVVDLTGTSLGSNGLLIIKAPGAGHAVLDPATTVVENAAFVNVGGALQNGTNSFLIVRATTAPVQGTDYDPDNNVIQNEAGSQFLGDLDLSSIGGQVIDGFGWIDAAIVTDRVYGIELPSFVTAPPPAAATRLVADASPLNVASWYYGELTGATNDSVTYDPAQSSTNTPAGAVLTPGGANFGAAAAAPRVTAVNVNGGQTNTTQRSRVTSIDVVFSAQVTFAGAVANAFQLSRIGGLSVGGFTATANVVGGVTVVTLDAFTGDETNFGSLADGRYQLTVVANQVTVNGQQLDGDGNGTGGDNFVQTGSVANGLFRFYGDQNGDGTDNAADFGLFRQAFGTSTGNQFFRDFLDFNNDGTINAADFGQFRPRFGASVP